MCRSAVSFRLVPPRLRFQRVPVHPALTSIKTGRMGTAHLLRPSYLPEHAVCMGSRATEGASLFEIYPVNRGTPMATQPGVGTVRSTCGSLEIPWLPVQVRTYSLKVKLSIHPPCKSIRCTSQSTPLADKSDMYCISYISYPPHAVIAGGVR